VLPKGIVRAIRHKQFRVSCLYRLGWGFPKVIKKGMSPIFWVHAVSVGEAQSASSFVRKMKELYPQATFVISSVTHTGHEAAKKTIPFADHHVFLPFDFFLCVAWVIRRCTPDVVFLSETDPWWRFLHTTKKKGATHILISGKMSATSFSSYTSIPGASFFAKKLFSHIDLFCLQNELYKSRFTALNIPPEKIHVTGNIKSDTILTVLSQEEKNAMRQKLTLHSTDFVVVIGSTHDPEEEIILNAIAPLFNTFSQLKVIIIPRHPERFAHVAASLQKYPISACTLSSLLPDTSWKILLVDSMGVLVQYYQLASLAIVAGSFTEKVGGHNILEPAAFGIPIITGPYMYGQQELADTAKSYGAMELVPPESLSETIRKYITNPAEAAERSCRARAMAQHLRGATERTIHILQPLVNARL